MEYSKFVRTTHGLTLVRLVAMKLYGTYLYCWEDVIQSGGERVTTIDTVKYIDETQYGKKITSL